ncbi:MAG: methyltransferase domain-containing protein [Ilumatobacteraceae bacterium]
MEPVDGARNFQTTGDAYDAYMGRYSRPLAHAFADATGVHAGMSALDVGCGPGALTGVLADRLGPDSVSAIDPSPPFVADCSRRHPGVDVREGRAEAIPFGDGDFDCALAQLVLHFVSDPPVAVTEMRRVVRPGGRIAACVWNFEVEMEMLRAFWDAALVVDPDALDVTRTLRFGAPGEIAELFRQGGVVDVEEERLVVDSTYSDYDELWAGFLAGIGPTGAFCVALDDDRREVLRDEIFERVGAPTGTFTLAATALCATGTVAG